MAGRGREGRVRAEITCDMDTFMATARLASTSHRTPTPEAVQVSEFENYCKHSTFGSSDEGRPVSDPAG